MSELFVGQIMMAGFNFAPKYFAQCNGQLLPTAQNQALFSLLGTQFGGNGSTTFALPDLRGRTPTGCGPSADAAWQPPSAVIGQSAGNENVSLLVGNLPAHNHVLGASTADGNSRNPATRIFAKNVSTSGPAAALYAAPGAVVALAPNTVAAAGGNQPHPNLQPYSTINFCIALSGIFPSRG